MACAKLNPGEHPSLADQVGSLKESCQGGPCAEIVAKGLFVMEGCAVHVVHMTHAAYTLLCVLCKLQLTAAHRAPVRLTVTHCRTPQTAKHAPVAHLSSLSWSVRSSTWEP